MEQIRFDKKFRLVMHLEAQSPMIHFQARELGGTIRPSEVKPKLDRFLLDKLIRCSGVESQAELVKDSRYTGFFQPSVGESPSLSLRYQMRIYCDTPPMVVSINNSVRKQVENAKDKPKYETVSLQRDSYKLYYGNSGINSSMDDQTMGVVSDPTVSIRCVHPGLQELITENIAEFFLVTNFGSMQGKGFGSFLPEGIIAGDHLTPIDRKRIGSFLVDHTNAKTCYYMDVGLPKDETRWAYGVHVPNYTHAFESIQHFYQLMKSGYNQAKSNGRIKPEYERSFLVEYMHKIGIGNEKAWMKQNHISPAFGTHPYKENEPDETPRYVRAFFGTAGNLSYQSEKGRVNVSVEHQPAEKDSMKLDRISSPIYFKIIKDTVFITAYPVPDEAYGQAFRFTGDKRKGFSSGELNTPEKELFQDASPDALFPMDDFLSRYVAHYNDLIDRNVLPRYLRGASYVEEVKF